MSPLPSPEERRKKLQAFNLDEVLGRDRHERPQRPVIAGWKSSHTSERENQRREAARRARPSSHPHSG